MIKLSESILNDIRASMIQMECKKIKLLSDIEIDHSKEIEILDNELARNQKLLDDNEIRVIR